MIRRLPIAVFLAFVLVAIPALAEYAPGRGNAWVAGRTYQGEVLDCDLPGTMHIKNIGSRRDGAGMCVMSSIEMAALLQGLEKYKGLRDWCAREAGGGYPGKVDKQLAEYCRSKNLPPPKYMQYEGPDPGPVIDAALKSGRMACITYGWGERYGQSIAHMICCVKCGTGQYAAVLDNNFPGEATYEWMSRDELIRRVRLQDDRPADGWVFVWLEGVPPPPSPRN
jgi:hypothetical protein